MGGYLSTESETKLYYPYNILVDTLGLTDYELDVYNRPVCLANINHNFLYTARLLYLTLCEEGYYEKLEPILKSELSVFHLLLTMIGYARTAGFSTEKILSILCYKEVSKEKMFSRFQSQSGKVYILEYGVMSSKPEVCAWKHSHLPVGSLIPGLTGTLKMLTGLDSLEHATTITNNLLNLEGKTRYYDVSTLKYRNGTEKAVLFEPTYRIMCSSEVQHYHFFLGLLKYPEVMKSFQQWLSLLSPSTSTVSSRVEPPVQKGKEVITKSIPDKPINKPSKRKTIPKAVRERVWRRHSNNFVGSCWVCGDPIKYESWHCAHIVPDSDGGLPNEDNLVPACAPCNLSMNDRHMYDYMYLYHTSRLRRLGWTRESCPIVVQ